MDNSKQAAANSGHKPLTGMDQTVRLAQIVKVLTKHNVLLSLAEQKHPERVRAAFEELGPTFVKVGQILSTRTDIVSEEYAAEFKKLQSHVKSDTFSVVGPIIEQEAGVPLEELFEKFEEKPLASASIAQVHAAVLKNGQKVVVKVQHPGIYDEMAKDIALLEKAVPLVKHIPAAGMVDPAGIVGELKRSLMDELDFTKEAGNIERFAELNGNVPYILSPKVYREFSTKRLLIMDFMQGVQISDYTAKANEEEEKGNTAVKETKKRLAREIVDNYMKQIFDDGFFHADPHPGNILVTLDKAAKPADEGGEATAKTKQQPSGAATEDPADEPGLFGELPLDFDVTVQGVSLSALFRDQDIFELFAGKAQATPTGNGPERIVYIDFGMMGNIDERTLGKFNAILGAFSQQDDKMVAQAILSLCKEKAPVDTDDFTADVGRLFSRYYNMPIGDMSLPSILEQVGQLCARHKLQLPQSVTLLVKGVGTIEGIVLALDPELSIMSAVMPYAKRYLKDQFDPKTEVQNFLKTLYRAGKTVPEIPTKIARVLDTLSRGEMKLSMETNRLDDLFKRLESMVNRLVMGLIVAALIIGSSMLVNYSSGSAQTAISAVGTVGYILALLLAVLMVVQTYRKRK